MKTRLWLVLGVTLLFIMSSCNEDKVISNNQLVKSISFTGQDFLDGDAVNSTRAAYTVDGTGFHFSWTQGDTVGIYPVGGDQVAFPISSGEGSQTAQFDGGAWALRSSYSYAAYYPFSSGNYHIKETNIPVSYIGQSQNMNGSLADLDRFDYQASLATKPDADGNVNISLKHLGCFVRFQLKMPVADTYKSITLQSNKTPFVTSGTFDLSKEVLAISPVSTSSTIAIGLNNVSTTDENKVLTVYAMLAPTNLGDSEITITVAGTKYQSYSAKINGKNMQAGMAYSYAATFKSGTNIDGSDVEWDDNVEEIGQYEYVDLGLSVNWATFNVGATAPEEYGDYFAWGEIETKTEYNWEQYKFCTSFNYEEDSRTKFSKYNTRISNGPVDNNLILDLEDDVAHVEWGGNWRMPTEGEVKELINNSTWIWYSSGNSEFGGIAGLKVTSNKEGYANRFIFLPAAGFISASTKYNAGSFGYYWSSSLLKGAPYRAISISANSGTYGLGYPEIVRCDGFTVRPVCPSYTWINNISVTLDNSELSMTAGNKDTLVATIKEGSNIIDYFTVTWSSSNPLVATVDESGVVTAVSEGNATIIASFKSRLSTCNVSVIGTPEPPLLSESEAVDLGLSVKWAPFNVGATAPEEYGDYFVWGETEPYYEPGYAQEDPQVHWKEGYSGYKWSSYKWCNGSSSELTKYCDDSDYGNNYYYDLKYILDPEDDVAHVNWRGNWRMPTQEELSELSNYENCTWRWTTMNGVNGFLITSKKTGYEDRSIFLPAAGYRSWTSLYNVDSAGRYWSSSLCTGVHTYEAWNYRFESGSRYKEYTDRTCGYSVRPVCP